ncbi:esterase [Corynebacterium sp. 13CS0277]|uniref:alpha/beta hydrolase n=1 Tax=Corynebacterium sp. 13CS0277 TaxID=2071994 RepID=UPI000D030A7D|nr:alpha/beta hydrolase family protein [Corynebacterium sp. 13CS0277]PRQ12189.1 esterase [Corynebacterium sp. 13CS0277]
MTRHALTVRALRLATAALCGVATVSAAPALAGTPAAEYAGTTPRATLTEGAKPGTELKWREITTFAPDRVKEVWAHSPSMDRDVPLLVLRAAEPNRPTLYLLNGGDGGEGRANWAMQSDALAYYWDKNVNVVIPMSGRFSYYTDWENTNAYLGGKQMWETFLTKELPQPIEDYLGANGKRAIAGMSMTATTTLLYAQHHPGFYDAIGSFSGCAQTNVGLGLAAVAVTLNRGRATIEQMWGPQNSPTRLYNDALLNAEKLRGTPMYISNSSGLAGVHDLPSSPRIKGDPVGVATNVITGGAIEGATNVCTHDLKAKLDAAGIPADWNFRPNGTHSWGYWQDDLRASWPTFARAMGLPEAEQQP